MPTPNINIIAQAVIAVMNNLVSPTVQIITFDFGNPTLPSAGVGGNAVFYDPFFQASVTGSNVSFPAIPSYCVAVQNLAPAGGSQLQITYTPNGGAALIQKFGPGGFFFTMDPSEQGQGTSFLTLLGVTAIVPCMVLVGV